MGNSAETAKIMAQLNKTAGAAWKSSRGKEHKPRGGGSRLPGGLNGAIGQLMDWEIKLNSKQKPMMSLEAVCYEPAEHHGKKFWLNYNLYPSETKTMEEQIDKVANDLGLLDCPNMSGVELPALPAALEKLKERGPFFEFNTWLPEGQTNLVIFIQGSVDYEPENPIETDDKDERESQIVTSSDVGNAEDVLDAGGGGDQDDEDFEAHVGEIYIYDGKECEVTAVDHENELVSLRETAKSGKGPKAKHVEHPSVAYNDLSYPPET